MVNQEEVIAIFDSKIEEASEITSEFLKRAKQSRSIIYIDPNETKSFIVTSKFVYFSPISSITLKKRAGFLEDIDEGIAKLG